VAQKLVDAKKKKHPNGSCCFFVARRDWVFVLFLKCVDVLCCPL